MDTPKVLIRPVYETPKITPMDRDEVPGISDDGSGDQRCGLLVDAGVPGR